MSIQTAPLLTADQRQQRDRQARQRLFINQHAHTLTVPIERDGKTITVTLASLIPIERRQAIQQLLNTDRTETPPAAIARAIAAPEIPAPAPPAAVKRKPAPARKKKQGRKKK